VIADMALVLTKSIKGKISAESFTALKENLHNIKAALEEALAAQTFEGKEAKSMKRATKKLNRLSRQKTSKGLAFRKAKKAVMRALRQGQKAMR